MFGIWDLIAALKALGAVIADAGKTIIGVGLKFQVRIDLLLSQLTKLLAQNDQMMGQDERKLAQGDRIIELLERLTASPPSQPARFGFRTISHVSVGDRTMLEFAVVNLPAVDMTDPNNQDFDKQVLTVTVADGEAQTFTSNSTDAIDEVLADDAGNPFRGNDGDALAGDLLYYDKKGNASKPRHEEATLTDDVGPSQPGEFGFAAKRQV